LSPVGTDVEGASVTALKDIKIDNLWLMHGDCLERMDEIPDNSVDLVLCDLPYGTTRNNWDCVIPLDALWAQYKRVSKGAVVLTAQTPFDKVLGMSNLDMLRYEWIWEKTEATGHLNAKKCPMKAHENILVFYNSLPVYNPQKTTGHQRKTARQVNAKQSTNYGDHRNKPPYDSTERYPRSVQTFSTDKQLSKLHPTQKPVALMEYLVRTYTSEGGVVLDNCMGSGTTGVACMNTGRRFIGIERDSNYYDIAVNRIVGAMV
ncbi:MAG: DNA-methyltransferase, partial [Aeromonas veronii]